MNREELIRQIKFTLEHTQSPAEHIVDRIEEAYKEGRQQLIDEIKEKQRMFMEGFAFKPKN